VQALLGQAPGVGALRLSEVADVAHEPERLVEPDEDGPRLRHVANHPGRHDRRVVVGDLLAEQDERQAGLERGAQLATQVDRRNPPREDQRSPVGGVDGLRPARLALAWIDVEERGPGGDGSRRWQLDLRRAEAVVEQALSQREADQAREGFEPNEWAEIAHEVYGWRRAKTYLAAVLCGLVARATDGSANPLSLQVGDDEASRGYAATSLWQTIQVQAQGRIDLRNLKSQPFNNSPFSGKRFLSTDWENVAPFNRPVLARTVELMEAVGGMSRDEAAAALRSFLFVVPDPVRDVHGLIDVAAMRLDLAGMFDTLDAFLLDDGENGRRAQAMVAACFAMLHPDHVDTPKSINDPSRSLPGDVRVVGALPHRGRLAMYAEAKQKYVPPEWVDQFAGEIKEKDSSGTGAYAALVNARATARGRRVSGLPHWRDVLRQSDVLMTIWDNPADMVRDAVIWSGLEVPEAVAAFVDLYTRYLRHVEVEPSTVDDWLVRAAKFGVAFLEPGAD